MEVKKMRVFLKEHGEKVPRSNEAVKKAYKEFKKPEIKQAPKTDNIVELVSSNVFTYIGMGDTPPEKINFMGRKVFVRGVPTEVNDPKVRAKLALHPCFTQDKVDRKKLEENDEQEARLAKQTKKEADEMAARKLG